MNSFECLFLLLVANGAPIVVWNLLGDRCNRPLDGGRCFFDGRPWFGPTKTLRGIAAAVLVTAAAALVLDESAVLGALFGAWAMAGDLLSSFIKRRLGLTSSGMALGLDQIPESLLPLWALHAELDLGASSIAALVAAFVALELVLSRLLFRLRLRTTPY